MEKSITLFLITLPILLFFSCKKPEKKIEKIEGYTITGTIATTKPDYIYIFDKTNKKIDSAKIKNRTFSLQGKIEKSDVFYIQLKNTDYKHPIVIENTVYNVLLNKERMMVIGGNLNTKLTNYQYKNTLSHKEKSRYYELLAAKDISTKTYLNKIDSLRDIEKKDFTNFIVDNENNMLSSIVLKQRKLSSKDVIELKRQITAPNNSNLLNELNTLAENLKIKEAAQKILRRKKAPLFSGVNLSGSKSSLKNLLKGKKAFLIDFWASWCPPCRESSPKIINLYKKYHKKGFDVLTVSEDRSVADWENGIYVDEIEIWHHIYDDYNRISSMYNATALPHMVLIDQNGKIIKNKISLKNLKIELEKIFKE